VTNGCFQHSLGQFLNEQRHAIRLCDNPFQEVAPEYSVRGRLRQRLGLPWVQPAQRDQTGAGAADPRHGEFDPKL
jgi:hypothetical protein